MARDGTDIEWLTDLCRPAVEAAGFDLILVRWANEGGRRILQLFIDHEQAGVTVDDCATVSRRLSHLLDVEDLVPGAYSLEVSTPGLNRPLVRERDFERFMGQVAKVTLRQPLPSGRKRLKGTLIRVDTGQLSMEVDGEQIQLALEEISTANLVYQGEF